MINHDYRFVHVHCRKAGGMSIGHLFPRFETHHNNMHDYIRMLGDEIKDYFVWTIVRNPWDRMVSSFFYELKIMQRCHTDSFPQYVRDMYEGIRDNSFDHFYDMLEQVEYLKDFHELPAYDYVACLGNIDRDFEMVKRRSGMLPELRFPRVNSTEHPDYRQYYNDDTKRMVAEMSRNDIETFGFVFEDKTAMRYPVQNPVAVPFQRGWRERLSWPMPD